VFAVVTRPPAAGRTSLSTALPQELGLPRLTRSSADCFSCWTPPDVAHSRTISAATVRALPAVATEIAAQSSTASGSTRRASEPCRHCPARSSRSHWQKTSTNSAVDTEHGPNSAEDSSTTSTSSGPRPSVGTTKRCDPSPAVGPSSPSTPRQASTRFKSLRPYWRPTAPAPTERRHRRSSWVAIRSQFRHRQPCTYQTPPITTAPDSFRGALHAPTTRWGGDRVRVQARPRICRSEPGSRARSLPSER
jgi:hypothetical protein